MLQGPEGDAFEDDGGCLDGECEERQEAGGVQQEKQQPSRREVMCGPTLFLSLPRQPPTTPPTSPAINHQPTWTRKKDSQTPRVVCPVRYLQALSLLRSGVRAAAGNLHVEEHSAVRLCPSLTRPNPIHPPAAAAVAAAVAAVVVEAPAAQQRHGSSGSDRNPSTAASGPATHVVEVG